VKSHVCVTRSAISSIFLKRFQISLSNLSYHLEVNTVTSNDLGFCPYAALEIETTATQQEIVSSYRRLARVYHPDKNPDNIEDATRAFQRVICLSLCLFIPFTICLLIPDL
jgi:preprotein translocase subunit Sec63